MHKSNTNLNPFPRYEVVNTVKFLGLTRNPEIGNTLVYVLPNIWRLGQVRVTKFGTNLSNKMSLNAAKCKGYIAFTVLLPPTQIRVNLPKNALII